MTTLSRDAILAAQDLPREVVPVPEWGGEVIVKSLSGLERDAYEEGCFVGRGKDRHEAFQNLRGRLVALAVVDEAGQRLFTDADAAALGQKSAAALDRVFAVAQRLAGLSAKDLADLEGNSAPGRNGGSTSGSPSASAA